MRFKNCFYFSVFIIALPIFCITMILMLPFYIFRLNKWKNIINDAFYKDNGKCPFFREMH